MSWIVPIWSMVAAASFTLAAVHGLVWWSDRTARANLWFSIAALATTAEVWVEISLMRSSNAEEFGSALRWLHVPLWFIVVALVGFVRLYLRAGRPWLGWTVIGLRSAALLINFLQDENLNFREITNLRPVSFFGESVAIAEGVRSPWAALGWVSFGLFVVFTADAALAIWRRGDRRRALVLGASLAFFMLLALLEAQLVYWRVLPWPLMASFFFLPLLGAMGYELSRDLLRVVRLSSELGESKKRLELAAAASGLGIWSRDLVRNELWATAEWRTIFGFGPEDRLNFEHYLQRLHPDDYLAVQQGLAKAIGSGGHYELEYRVVVPDKPVRWISSRGNVEYNDLGRAVLIRGVSADITPRRAAEIEVQQQRTELAHLARVASLGELSGSLAHEINQPLAIILSNAQAAQRLLTRNPPDLAEVRDIIEDIINADRRAGEVIMRLRALLRHGEGEWKKLSLPAVIDEVLALMRSDLITRGISVARSTQPAIPLIHGDHIPLQQVLLNLFTNACDAMATNPPGDRRLTVETKLEGSGVRVSISDNGCGLPAEAGRIFEPFFTTKTHGLGMGLAICRTIINAHGGRLWPEPNPARGTTFHLELPAVEATP